MLQPPHAAPQTMLKVTKGEKKKSKAFSFFFQHLAIFLIFFLPLAFLSCFFSFICLIL